MKMAEVRSGVFVVLALLAFTVLVFAVGNLRARFQAGTEYHAFLTDAKFVKPHDPVTYGGLRVGEIQSVGIADERFGHVKLVVSVRPDIPVREDSALVLKQDGVLGVKYVEISPGTAEAKRAAAGGELKAVVPPDITDISASIGKPLATLDQLLQNLNALVGSPDNQKNMSAVLAETRTLLSNLQVHLEKLADAGTKTSERAQALMGDAQAALKSADALSARLLKTADALDPLLRDSQQLARSADQFLRDADAALLQNNKNLYETIRAMRDTAYHMEQAAKRIRANPTILLFGAEETPEERARRDETELRLKGRAPRYDKEQPK